MLKKVAWRKVSVLLILTLLPYWETANALDKDIAGTDTTITDDSKEREFIQEEFGSKIWIMFIPTKKNDPAPFMIGVSEIKFDGPYFSGLLKAANTPTYFKKGTITKIKNNTYEFKIVIQSDPSDIIFRGKISTDGKQGYTPKSDLENTIIKVFKSNGGKFFYKITDGVMFCETGIPTGGKTTFSNGRGFLLKPLQH